MNLNQEVDKAVALAAAVAERMAGPQMVWVVVNECAGSVYVKLFHTEDGARAQVKSDMQFTLDHRIGSRHEKSLDLNALRDAIDQIDAGFWQVEFPDDDRYTISSGQISP